MKGDKSKTIFSLVILLIVSFFYGTCAGAESLIFNGSLDPGLPTWPRPDAATVERLRASGWKCPEADGWPAWWQPKGSNVTLEVFPTGGKQGAYARISGKGGSITCPAYSLKEWLKWVKEEEQKKFGEDYLFEIWARGNGTLRVSFEAFGKSKDGKTIPVESPESFIVKVASDNWVRYSHVIHHRQDITSIHPVVSAPEGVVDFDELTLWPVEPARALLVEEQERLYGTGALIENMHMAAADGTFFAKAAEFESAVKVFRTNKDSIDEKLFQSMEDVIKALRPYVLTKGITVVQVTHYNDIIAATRVLKRLAGEDPGEAAVIRVAKVKQGRIFYKPGVREARPGKVTITDVRSNKVRYNENEMAHTTVTIVSMWSDGVPPPAASGQLIARMIIDLDTVREVARTDFTITIPSRHKRIEEKKWEFTYNVGPETYGRALEVEFVDKSGKTIDKWQEYFAVAAEYFRVQQHTYDCLVNRAYKVDFWTTYFNQLHYFASEPTDLGVQVSDVEAYYSGQAGYRMNWLSRRPAMNNAKNAGVALTFYQTSAFCGQMGYEELRKHPEYALYDENGQFAVDPVYGGYPNPMELASPIEIGPKRENLKIKPYLDREYTPWQHTLMNLAMEDAVVYAANCIKEYAKAHGFDGVYWDGTLGLWKGYAYDGTPNVPSDKPEDYIRLNARNHRIYSEILKRDNPNFGTWYNWGKAGAALYIGRGLTFFYGSGTGVRGDVSDEAIRTALAYKNVMILDERHGMFRPGDSLVRYPDKFLASLLEQRDFIVQKYGGNTIIGYDFAPLKAEEPGTSKWGWPAVNYLMAQIIATQHHIAAGFYPSYRPALQFLTRYSRFIWAPDIKAVPVDEVEKIIHLETPEKIWWKRLVYKRKRSDGYDLIIHLVRIPPTEKWDINWVDEPVPLEGVKITADIGSSTLQTAQACRPYYFEEDQQVVQKVLKASADTGRVSVEISPFRYYTMVVFRVTDTLQAKSN